MFQALFGHFKHLDSDPAPLVKTVNASIMGIERNFLSVLAFMLEFRQFIRLNHNPADFKYNTTDDDRNIYHLITENAFFDQLESDEQVAAYLAKPHILWQEEQDTLFLIYKEIKKEDEFNLLKVRAMEDGSDFGFAQFFYRYLIKQSVEFEHLMEEKVIVWYDEKIPILKNLDRLFKGYEENKEIVMPPLSRDLDEDLQFSTALITHFVAHKEELEATINEYTPGWDSERITKIDFILMCMALCEFKYLDFVPVKVSINEYIEIAKMYSTPQSSKFLNGTLDKILKEWQAAGEINKSGRGLIG